MNLTIPAPQTKTCTKCGETKPRQEFYAYDSEGNVLKRRCKACCIAASRAARIANPERRKIEGRAYYVAHREECKARDRAYVAANPEKIRARKLVSVAVRSGKLARASDQFCFSCGTSTDQGATMHYHHVDYSKPLEVIPMCGTCHTLWHAAQDVK